MMKKYFMILLAFIIFSLTFIILFGTPWPWKIIEARNDSKAYLEQTYHEQFDVKLPRFWIMDGNFHAEASPVTYPEIIFIVGTEQGEDGIQDNYVLNAWRYEGEKIIEATFSPLYDANEIIVDIDVTMYSNDPQLNKDAASFSLTIDLRDEEHTAIEEELPNIYEGLLELKANELQVTNLQVYCQDQILRLDYVDLNGLGSAEELGQYIKKTANSMSN